MKPRPRKARAPRLGRLRRLLLTLRGGFPLTAAGFIAAAGGVLAFGHYGLRRLDLILLALGIVIVTLLAVTTLAVLVAALVVRRAVARRIDGGALRAECGYFAPTDFRLPALRWIPFVQVRWTWEAPEAEVKVERDGRWLVETIRPTRRGAFGEVVRRIEVAELFGFAVIAFRATEKRIGRFAPWVGGLEKMPLVQGLAGGADLSHPEGDRQGDPFDTRRYAPGDPIRFVLWKVFAKTRQLIVRSPETALAPDRRTIAYLVAGDGDEPAAGAARVAVTSGALGSSWVLGADGCAEEASSAVEAIDVLARSAQAGAEARGAVAAFLERVGRTPGTRAVVFVPPRLGPWLERVQAATRVSGGPLPGLEFVVCTDGIETPARRSWLSRAAAPATPKLGGIEPTRRDELLRVVDALRATGSTVLVVDRPAGKLFDSRALRGGTP